MLDATERKTLAWITFVAGVLCLIPGDTPKGPRPWDYAREVLGRIVDHHATQIAWVLCLLLVAHHLWRTRREEAASAEAPASSSSSPADPTPPAESARTSSAPAPATTP